MYALYLPFKGMILLTLVIIIKGLRKVKQIIDDYVPILLYGIPTLFAPDTDAYI